MKNSKNLLFVLIIVAVVVGIVGWQKLKPQPPVVTSYEDCAAAGYPIMESYPEQCRTPDGRTFVNLAAQPQTINVTGEVVCLPHKNREGPQTMECAYGLMDQNGTYYGLSSDIAGIPPYDVGDTISVEGKLVPPDPSNRYDIIGVIEVDSSSK